MSNNNGEISVVDLINSFKSAIRYIRARWLSILMLSILGLVIGLCYSIIKKPTYKAVCTFVLEDAKSGGGLGQYAGLASLAGINIGGGGNGGGIFEGDNILELYKSRRMIETTLLNTCNFNGKKQLLIDRFIDNNMRKAWINDTALNHISFYGDPDNFNRKQDSIVTDLVELFNKNMLNVIKPDKKLSIISVEVTSKDELFSKYFTEKLVQTVNDFYIRTKTKKAYQNVQLLQHQADSVKNILNSSINGVASAIDAAPNANPAMFTLKTTSQKRQVDVQANTAIYGEMVKNLELEKISLSQDAPLIQVIDKPVLPLVVNKVGKIKGALIGAIIAMFLTILILVFRRIITRLN
jgi:hypothetical protein